MAVHRVTLQLGGVEHALILNLKALSAIEDAGYAKVGDLLDRLTSDHFSFKALQTVIWAALQHEKPPPSFDAVGEWVDGDYAEVVEKVGELIRLAFPEGKQSENPPGRGTGAPSSAPAPAAG